MTRRNLCHSGINTLLRFTSQKMNTPLAVDSALKFLGCAFIWTILARSSMLSRNLNAFTTLLKGKISFIDSAVFQTLDAPGYRRY